MLWVWHALHQGGGENPCIESLRIPSWARCSPILFLPPLREKRRLERHHVSASREPSPREARAESAIRDGAAESARARLESATRAQFHARATRRYESDPDTPFDDEYFRVYPKAAAADGAAAAPPPWFSPHSA